MRAGLVSTVIPVYNRPQMIGEAVASVLAQDYPQIEVIIVDDGCTDNTPAVLAELASGDPRIAVIHQENQGVGAARQRGTELSQGEFVQYLDSDDLLLPGKFRRQVAALLELPEADVAYGMTECVDVGEPLRGQAYKRTGERILHMFPLFLRERWWSTSTPLIRRSAIDAIGPWLNLINEEDWEYDCRLAARGKPLAYVPEFVSVTRRHEQHLSDRGGVDQEKLRSRCVARQGMYHSAVSCPQLVSDDDRQFFSRAAFLLARECAGAGLNDEVDSMLALSIRAHGHPRRLHRLFKLAGQVLGWRRTAYVIRQVERWGSARPKEQVR